MDVLAILFAEAKNFVLFGVHTSYGEMRDRVLCSGIPRVSKNLGRWYWEVLDCDREPDNAVDHYAVKLSSCLFNHSYLFVGTTN